MDDNILELDFSKELEFEDFCDKKYISQIPEDELISFARRFFLHKKGKNCVEVSSREYNNSGVELDESYLDKDLIIYYVRDIHKGNQWHLPEVEIRYLHCQPRRDWFGDDNNKVYAYFDYGTSRFALHIFSDFTISKPGFIFNTWSFEPSYFMFMYRKFGEEYCNSLLERRRVFRAYYLTRERAKRDNAIKLMKENALMSGIKPVPKTTETFIGSATTEMIKRFHLLQVRGEPWVIDVTNFQTLKNEDIPEENKDNMLRTMLRRIKPFNQDGHWGSIEEYQWREQKVDWNGEEYIRYYRRKNNPVQKRKYEFDDFSLKLNDSDWYYRGDFERLSVWTGIMYSAFGEEYYQAYKKTFDDKIDKFIGEFDAETIKIIEIIQRNCTPNPRLKSGETTTNKSDND